MSTFGELVVLLALVLLNGFLSAAEIAILMAKRNRLETAAEEGRRGPRLALRLLEDPSRFLSTVQVGITVLGTLAAAYSGAELVDEFAEVLSGLQIPLVVRHAKSLSLALVTGTLAFTTLVLGELVPKRVALSRAEAIASFVSPAMYGLSVIARPVVAMLGGVTTGILAVLRIPRTEEPVVTLEDIEHLIETGTVQGVLESSERQMVIGALQLGERRVRDIMRPRVDIDAVDIETPVEEVVGAVAMSGFSRLPVYEGSLDNVLGFIYIKDVFQQHYLRHRIDLRKILHPALYVPENITLDRLLTMFQDQKTQLAIVVDEFGGTEGMVTFEDVLEELVGEIHDEHRQDDDQMIVERGPGSWLVDGRVPLHDLWKRLPDKLNAEPPPESISTVSGLVLAQLERIPRVGEVAQWGQVRIEVVDMDGTRIDRVLVSVEEKPASDA